MFGDGYAGVRVELILCRKRLRECNKSCHFNSDSSARGIRACEKSVTFMECFLTVVVITFWGKINFEAWRSSVIRRKKINLIYIFYNLLIWKMTKIIHGNLDRVRLWGRERRVSVTVDGARVRLGSKQENKK